MRGGDQARGWRGWSWRGGGMTSLEPKSGNKERMGADVDVGL